MEDVLRNEKSDNSCSWFDIIHELYPRVVISLENIPKSYLFEENIIERIWQLNIKDLNLISRWIDTWITNTSNKDEAQSHNFRALGNELFKCNKLHESAQFYTKSILNAPYKSVSLALAFANRSAIEYQNLKYEKCIKDIQLCLKNIYPDYLKHKVFFRLANCYCNIGNFIEAQKALDETRVWLLKADVTNTKKGEIKKMLNDLQIKVNEKVLNSPKKSIEILVPEPAYGENVEFLYASNAILLKNSAKVGRYVIAVKDIKMGDILFSEEPYATVSVQKTFLSCSHCGIECNESALPCKNCINSCYCSEKCQKFSWELYHQWECVAVSSNLVNIIGIGYLALKILLKGSHVNFNSEQDLVKSSSMNDYSSIFNLVSNIHKMNIEDIALYSLTSIMVTEYLEKKTDFFKWYLDKCPLDVIKFKKHICSLLLRHMCQIQCNASLIQVRNNKISKKNLISAICSSASMMNHSCDSNVFTDSFNYRLIIRAAKDINLGEEITNSYGVHYTIQSFEDRQEKLSKQYYFICECAICSSNNLEIKYHCELFNAFKCTYCCGRVLQKNMICFDCKRSVVINFDNYNKAIDYAVLGDSKSFVLKCFENCLHKDNKKIRQLCEDIAIDYEQKRKYEKALSFRKRVIKMLQKQCGENSTLVTKQMIQTSYLILKLIQELEFQHSVKFITETTNGIKFIKETKEKVSYRYGSWNSVYKVIDNCLETAEKLLESYNHKINTT